MMVRMNRRCRWLVALSVCLLQISVICADDSLLVTVDTKPISTRLRLLNEGRATFADKADKQLEFALQDVVRWGSLSNPHSMDQVLLTDRSILIGRITRITRDAFVLETDLWAS